MRMAGYTPDPWQQEMVECDDRKIAVLCTRRAGKSLGVADKVLAKCLLNSNYPCLIFSPTEDQSKEFLSYVAMLNDALGCPIPLVRQSMTELAWANGSRVKAKPDSPKGSRGFTPRLIVIDEAAQVSDELRLSVQPMTILGNTEEIVLSTPYGKMGWFFDLWDSKEKLAQWRQFKVTAYECPRIDPAELELHRHTMPKRWFEQEYMLAFNDAVDAVFSKETIESAVYRGSDELFKPLVI